MDGRPPASTFARLGWAVCLSLLCWMALRIWVPKKDHSRSNDPKHQSALANQTVPSSPPLIDWSLFRFPALDVTLDGECGEGAAVSGSLLELLEPRRAPRIADGSRGYVPRLELQLNPPPRQREQLSLADLERLATVARGIDAWFPDDGLFHPWAVLGFNTNRAWSEVGCWWGQTVPCDFGASAVRIAAAAHRHWRQTLATNQPREPVRLIGPRLVAGPEDRLAMVPTPVAPPEMAIDNDPFVIAEPTTLLNQLEWLSRRTECALWACEVDERIRQLCTGDVCDAGELTATLQRLARLGKQARKLASECNDNELRTVLMQAYYGLKRRIDRWQLAADLHERRTNHWARRSTKQRRKLSQAMLSASRFAQRDSDLGAGLQGALDDELQALVSSPFNVPELLADLEMLESDGSSRVAQAIAASQRQLIVSPDDRYRQLADEIEEHYRNANFRVAVSGELLNLWLPEQSPLAQPVRDRIAGSPVQGRARTTTELFVRLIPDPFIWRFGLEAKGEVAAVTSSGEGSATVRTEGTTTFEARKLLLVRADGVQAWPAVATANATQRLLGVASSYDQVPFMGSYIRSQATQEYHRRREIASREVESKVAHRARTTLDEQTEKWLQDMERQVRSQLLRRTEQLALEITPIELRTTDKRLIARLRLANENQLAAYTPRPQAPADSLLSIQVHESAVTNALLGLKLDGCRLTAADMVELLQDKFAYVPAEVPPDALRTEFVFADEATQVHFQEGVVRLTLSIAQMKHDRSQVQNFKVHAIYRPEVEGLSAKLVREGSLQMEGRLRHIDRARLHAVFGRVLAEDRQLELVRLPGDEAVQRLTGLMVTHMVIDDGWLGLSIGPETTARTAIETRHVR